MRNILKLEVPKSYKGRYLKDFLKEESSLSSRMIKRLAMDKMIFNGKKSIRLDSTLKGNEILIINLDRKEDQDIEAVKMDLDIVYEDESLLVVNKAPFMVVHPTKSHQKDTLANGLTYYFRQKKEATIVRLVSRLDMNTTGLVLVAKNQFSHSFLAREMKGQRVEKVYLALVEGKIQDEGLIDKPIAIDPENPFKRRVDQDGQEAKTSYRLISYNGKFSLVEFTLHTGRTHQIRVHTSFIGHPILNDELYGGKIVTADKRQFLHAYFLSFIHPMTGERIELRGKLAKDMEDFIKDEGLDK